MLTAHASFPVISLLAKAMFISVSCIDGLFSVSRDACTSAFVDLLWFIKYTLYMSSQKYHSYATIFQGPKVGIYFRVVCFRSYS